MTAAGAHREPLGGSSLSGVVSNGCRGPGCERPLAGHGGDLCVPHLKQWQRAGKLTAIKERPPTLQARLLEAVIRWVETDAEDDEAYERRCRAVLVAATDLGLERAKRLGWRPPDTEASEAPSASDGTSRQASPH